jgi:hypothetical protein
VRVTAGPSVSPVNAGRPVYSGTLGRATLTGLVAGQVYTVTAYSVDRSGNVGAARSVTVAG